MTSIADGEAIYICLSHARSVCVLLAPTKCSQIYLYIMLCRDVSEPQSRPLETPQFGTRILHVKRPYSKKTQSPPLLIAPVAKYVYQQPRVFPDIITYLVDPNENTPPPSL